MILNQKAKRIALVLLCLGLLATMCSCGASQSATDDGKLAPAPTSFKEPMNITYWYAFKDNVENANLTLVQQFHDTVGKEMNINVTAEYQGGYIELQQKLSAAHVAGATPAVAVVDGVYTDALAGSGLLNPITAYIERDGVDMSDFYQGLLMDSVRDNVNYGLPFFRSTPILYLNATLLEKAGLDPNGPTTWDELAEFCKTVKEQTGAYGMTLRSDVWLWEAFLMQNGTKIFNEDESATNINTDAGKHTVQFFRDLKDQGYIHCVGVDRVAQEADFMNQNTAMWFTSTASIANSLAIAEENGFELNTAFMPKNTAYGVPTGGCNMIMGTKNTDEEKEAAWQFMKFMTGTEQSALSSELTGYMPVRQSSSETDRIQSLYQTTPEFKVAVDQLAEFSAPRPKTPAFPQILVETEAALDAMWMNDADVNTELAALETKVNQLLADAK